MRVGDRPNIAKAEEIYFVLAEGYSGHSIFKRMLILHKILNMMKCSLDPLSMSRCKNLISYYKNQAAFIIPDVIKLS